jgi:hypothetical protein
MACPVVSTGEGRAALAMKFPVIASWCTVILSFCNYRFVITKLKLKCSSIGLHQWTFVTGERILTCERKRNM